MNLHPDVRAGVPGGAGGPAAVLATVRSSHCPELQKTPLGQDLPAGILLKPQHPSAATQQHPQQQQDGAGASPSLIPRSRHRYLQQGALPVPLDVGVGLGSLWALQEELPPCHSRDDGDVPAAANVGGSCGTWAGGSEGAMWVGHPHLCARKSCRIIAALQTSLLEPTPIPKKDIPSLWVPKAWTILQPPLLALSSCTAGVTLPWMLTWKLLLSSPAGLVARQVYKPPSATCTARRGRN